MAIRAIATDSQDFNNPSTTGKPGRDERLDFKNEAGDTVFSIVSDADGTASIQGDAVPKVYRALLTQSSTDAPTATVLENTLGATIAWARFEEGDGGAYAGTASAEVFTADKTCLPAVNASVVLEGVTNFVVTSFYRNGADDIRLQTAVVDPAGNTLSLSDGLLTSTYVEILVYP